MPRPEGFDLAVAGRLPGVVHRDRRAVVAAERRIDLKLRNARQLFDSAAHLARQAISDGRFRTQGGGSSGRGRLCGSFAERQQMNDIDRRQRWIRHVVGAQAIERPEEIQRNVVVLHLRHDEEIERWLGSNGIGKDDGAALHLVAIAHKK